MSSRYLFSLRLFALVCCAVATLPAAADPSGRVGRISSTQGYVTFRASVAGDTQAAALNWPITSGNELITDSNARAEFRVGSAAVRLDGNSDLEVLQLDDQHFALRLQRGSVEVRIRNAELARDFSLDTPQGHILLAEPSTVRVDARNDTPLTALSVISGSASFDGGNTRFALPAGRRAEVANGDLQLLQSRSAYGMDDFDNWTAQRDQQDDRSVSTRYLSAETTGYEELDNNGSWRVTTAYGPIWSPSSVPVDWAPYRDGRWTWISPWGWTWVDNAPWGYAPSHYGRWVFYDQRWCWTPGAVVARPIWAPALVGWVGGRSWQVGFSTGVAPAVGWFPLAPREPYWPGYAVSPTYVQQINNTTIINGNVTNNHYYNGSTQNYYQNQSVQNAVTVMPQSQFSVSKTVTVTPTTLGSRQAAFLHSAPVSAISPVASPPRAAMVTAAPITQPRGGMSGMISNGINSNNSSNAALTRIERPAASFAPPAGPSGQQFVAPMRVTSQRHDEERPIRAIAPAPQDNNRMVVGRPAMDPAPAMQSYPATRPSMPTPVPQHRIEQVEHFQSGERMPMPAQRPVMIAAPAHAIAVAPTPMQAPMPMPQSQQQPAPVQHAAVNSEHHAAPQHASHERGDRDGPGRPGQQWR
ncbi:MAG: hypothetical protein M3N23_05735 [Pseudomonadota bacterium]|nr:hypothetical protein [Pseudomonadota bacterium]